jgi:hypothetical protein
MESLGTACAVWGKTLNIYDPVFDAMASIKAAHGVNGGGACGVNFQLTLRSSSAQARHNPLDCLVLGSASLRSP